MESLDPSWGVKVEEVVLQVPEGNQLILGQSHFIKTIEDIYEVLVTSMPGIKFGVAFCEASGKALIRYDGTDDEVVSTARKFASRLGAGHCFAVVLKGAFPINVLNRLKNVEEVTGIYCATSNPVTVMVADTGEGRGILGVVDGVSPKGSETTADKKERHEFLRKTGYKR
ncbi:MAG: adenosine-specific kinase [Nitrososphaerales archaeon]